jgi:hypothetical protein
LHLRGETKKYIFCKAGIPNAFFAGGKAKIVYFVEGKDLFTLIELIVNLRRKKMLGSRQPFHLPSP